MPAALYPRLAREAGQQVTRFAEEVVGGSLVVEGVWRLCFALLVVAGTPKEWVKTSLD